MTLLPYSERCFRDWPTFELRDYQAPARDALLDWAQGIYKAPTGAGKSRVVLEFARWAGQRTLIVVGKTSLARQWQEMAREGYGYETGYIGEGSGATRTSPSRSGRRFTPGKTLFPPSSGRRGGAS